MTGETHSITGGEQIEVELEPEGTIWIKLSGAYFRPDDWVAARDFVDRTLVTIGYAEEPS